MRIVDDDVLEMALKLLMKKKGAEEDFDLLLDDTPRKITV